MRYDFRCDSCGNETELDVPLDSRDNNQVCPKCNGLMKRILSWNGTYHIRGVNTASVTPNKSKSNL